MTATSPARDDARVRALQAKVDLMAFSVDFTRMSDVAMRPVKWLWRGRIAQGKVTLVAGHPGLGKSQIAASFAAITTTGGRWPVDRTEAPCGSVVILSAEDDPEDTIGPRLMAAGADLTRVYVARAIRECDDDGVERRRHIDLGRDLEHLDGMLRTIGGAAMIIIDPLTAYLGGIDSHRTSDVRGIMAPLSELAERHQAAVVAISHLRKQGGAEAMMAITGSMAFVAAARAAYIIARDPDDERRRLMLPAKNNLGDDSTGFAYTIESVTVGDDIPTSRVLWDNQLIALSADEALGRPLDDVERTERTDAADWLRSEVEHGPVDVKDLQKRARDAGHAWPTVKRAKSAIGAVAEKSAFTGGWRWSLSKEISTPSTLTSDPLRVDKSRKPNGSAAFTEGDHPIPFDDLLGADIEDEGDHEGDHRITPLIPFGETRTIAHAEAAAIAEEDHPSACDPLCGSEKF